MKKIEIDKKLKEIDKRLKELELEELETGTVKKEFTDDRKYVGQVCKIDTRKKNIPDGMAIVTLSDGEKYSGEFKNGLFDGTGTYEVPGSHEITGLWKEGHIVNGQVFFEDGRIYLGEFKNGKFDGKGTMTSPDGSTYRGQWKNHNAEGKGTLTYAKDIKDENGNITTKGGTCHEGTWKDGFQEGLFNIVYSDGAVCEAYFEKGKITKTKWRD